MIHSDLSSLRHRLGAAGDVDDAQPGVAKADRPTDMSACGVRAPVADVLIIFSNSSPEIGASVLIQMPAMPHMRIDSRIARNAQASPSDLHGRALQTDSAASPLTSSGEIRGRCLD